MRARKVNLSGHMPVLDGFRGLAILGVVIFHTTILRATAPIDDWYFKFGRSLWIGVDLFFVLSGFLITGILYGSKSGKNYFRNFYARRTLRIFPLYLLVVSVSVFLLPGVTHHFPALGDKQWWYWTYMSNFLVVQEGFRHLVLGPTWSLAIEEQFYIVWPFLVYFLSRKTVMRLCLLMIVAACGIRWWLLFSGENVINHVYVATYTRMDALAVGALLALAARGPDGIRGLFPWIWVPFLLCLPAAFHFLIEGHFNKKLPEMIKYGYSLAAVLFGSSLVIALSRPEFGLVHWLLTRKTLLFYGKYSYAIYLFNRPLVDLLEEHWFAPNHLPRLYGSSIPGQVAFTLAVLAISTFMAVISWHAFEKHFLKLKGFFRDRQPAAVELLPKAGSAGKGETVSEQVPAAVRQRA